MLVQHFSAKKWLLRLNKSEMKKILATFAIRTSFQNYVDLDSYHTQRTLSVRPMMYIDSFE